MAKQISMRLCVFARNNSEEKVNKSEHLKMIFLPENS